jgi:hypothetical protein
LGTFGSIKVGAYNLFRDASSSSGLDSYWRKNRCDFDFFDNINRGGSLIYLVFDGGIKNNLPTLTITSKPSLTMRSGMASSKSLFSLIGLTILIAGLNSCSLTFEKRHYRKGYHIEVVKNNPHRIITGDHPTDEVVNFIELEKKQEEKPENPQSTEIKENEIKVEHRSPRQHLPAIHKKSVIKLPSKKIKRGSECDVITLKDGAQIDAIIVNIGEDVIAYKKCNFESGPLYTISTGSVEMIYLRNGDYYKPKANMNTSNTKGNSNGVGEMIVSILAFVFSLFAFVMCFLGFAYGATVLTGIFGTFGFILGIIGTVFSAIRMNSGNKKHTLPGIILGALAILLFMVAITILVLV